MKLVNAKIFDTEKCEFILGSVTVDEASGKIKEVMYGDSSSDGIDLCGDMLVPGFIDSHSHGRNGFDFNKATKDEMKKLAKGYLEKGVTTVMATLASDIPERLAISARLIREAGESGDGARFAGVHLEGRYLNASKRGAHAAELLTDPNESELSVLLDAMGTPCHISAALELDADGRFAKLALEKGATLGLAHTGATCKQALEIYERTGASFTHTYNAMTPLHHREAGVVGAALLCDGYAELICDGLHICPEVVALTYKMKGSDRLVLVSDSMEATGHGDGEYHIAGMKVIVKDGKAHTTDGALAGSTLELADGVRNLVRFAGISLEKAIPCATRNPANMLKLDDCGSIESGKRADMLVITEDTEKIFEIKKIILNGAFVKE